MAQRITHPKRIQKKSRAHSVRQLRPNWFKVRDYISGRVYDVNLGLNGGTCTCAWGQHRRNCGDELSGDTAGKTG